MLSHDIWGDDLYTRTVTKTVAMPILLGAGAVGVGGVAVVGAGAVACGVTVGAGLLVVTPFKLAYDAIPFPWKPTPPTPANYTHNEILLRGFKVELPRHMFSMEVAALTRSGDKHRFMGFEGRLGDNSGVFVAYHTFNGNPTIIYFVPMMAAGGVEGAVDEVPDGVTDLELPGIEDTETNVTHVMDACIQNALNAH